MHIRVEIKKAIKMHKNGTNSVFHNKARILSMLLSIIPLEFGPLSFSEHTI
jgi:hypothetical protein